MLNEMGEIVNWCMIYGLKKFNDRLMEQFKVGLPLFDVEESPKVSVRKRWKSVDSFNSLSS